MSTRSTFPSDALTVAQRNVSDYGLADRINLIRSDLFSNLSEKSYDLIISNPPYVTALAMENLPPEYRHEPGLALAGGEDGLDAVRTIVKEAPRFLNPGRHAGGRSRPQSRRRRARLSAAAVRVARDRRIRRQRVPADARGAGRGALKPRPSTVDRKEPPDAADELGGAVRRLPRARLSRQRLQLAHRWPTGARRRPSTSARAAPRAPARSRRSPPCRGDSRGLRSRATTVAPRACPVRSPISPKYDGASSVARWSRAPVPPALSS